MTDDPTRTPRAVLVRMRAEMPVLTPAEQRVAQLFLDDPGGTAELAVARVAELARTSGASVVRFGRRMGYAHYRELRADVLREHTRARLAAAELPEVSGDIDQGDSLAAVVAKISRAETLSIADTAATLDVRALQAAVDAVSAAPRVDVFGVGASALVGLDLQQKLSRIGRVALNWSDAHAAWTAAVTLGPGAVAVGVSHSGGTSHTVEFLALARQRGATTIAMTNHAGAALAVHADVVLTTAARETTFRSGAMGSRIAQLMIVDCLFVGVAQAAYDTSMAAIRDTYAAVHRTTGRRD